jgi:hypothetical protein
MGEGTLAARQEPRPPEVWSFFNSPRAGDFPGWSRTIGICPGFSQLVKFGQSGQLAHFAQSAPFGKVILPDQAAFDIFPLPIGAVFQPCHVSTTLSLLRKSIRKSHL